MDGTPYIYLNFVRFRDQLETHLIDLRKRHRGELFPTLHPETPILDYFVETFFDEGHPATYLFSNSSLKDRQVDLTIRSPRTRLIGEEMPEGISLCVRGTLGPPHDPSPEVVVDRISEVAEAPQRNFEKDVEVIPVVSPKNRVKNVLTPAFVRNLPEISRITREKLSHWIDYLDWQAAILESRQKGFLYRQLTVEKDQVVLSAVFQNQDALNEALEIVKRESMEIYPPRASLQALTFQPDRNGRFNGRWLGSFIRSEPIEKPNPELLNNLPWPDAKAARLFFAFSEKDQRSYQAVHPDYRDETRDYIRKQFPAAGFFSVSLFGEMSLLQRQKAALNKLAETSGYAPFLSSWLFDIEQANLPQISPEIDHWLLDGINEGQQRAIHKILGAPDVALLQGPPGTGKTTVIGEAIYQLVRQGKKVLLASQANLAVDNALEKLASVPEIRAIRLGRSHKLSEEGQAFAEDQALRKFYHAIGEALEDRYLSRWGAADEAAEELQVYLQKLEDLVARGKAVKVEKDNAIAGEGSAAELFTGEDITRGANRSEMVHLQQQRLFALADFLEKGGEHRLVIHEKLLDLIWRSLVVPLSRLTRYKIDINPFWLENDERYSNDEKTVFFEEIYRKWLNIREMLPDLQLEFRERLEVPDNKPRNKALYQKLFTRVEKGQPFYRYLAHPALDDHKVGLFLKESARALESTENHLSAAVATLVKNLHEMATRLGEAGELTDFHGENPTGVSDQPEELAPTEEGIGEEEQESAVLIAKMREEGIISGEMAEAGSADLITHLRQRISDLLDANLSESIEDSGFRDKWEPLLREWSALMREPEQLANDNQHYMDIYLRNCNVIGITCNENPRLLEGKGQHFFDVAIIDEVSKATPPELIMPMIMARKSILVGDHRQLPPLFKEREGSWSEAVAALALHEEEHPAAHLLTEENFFKFRDMVTAALFKEYFEKAPQAIKTTLLTQYRMHPQIMDVVNFFYDHNLNCGLKDPEKDRNHGLTLTNPEQISWLTPDLHAMWIDTSKDGDGKPHYERQSGTSKINNLEIAAIDRMLEEMNLAYRERGFGQTQRKEVGVISFYGRQVAELRRRIRRDAYECLDIDVNTVDQFQGKEKPVILVSLVRNTPAGAAAANAFVKQFERINVAFSRAQELLVIFGARHTFEKCEVELPLMDQKGTLKKAVYGEIMEMLNRRAAMWPAGEVLLKETGRGGRR